MHISYDGFILDEGCYIEFIDEIIENKGYTLEECSCDRNIIEKPIGKICIYDTGAYSYCPSYRFEHGFLVEFYLVHDYFDVTYGNSTITYTYCNFDELRTKLENSLDAQLTHSYKKNSRNVSEVCRLCKPTIPLDVERYIKTFL